MNRWIVALGLFASVLSAGCEDKRRHRATEDVEFAALDLTIPEDATPDAVVGTWLRAAREFQTVRQEGLGKAGNKEKYDRSMAALRELAARKVIHDQLKAPAHRSQSIPSDITEDAAVRTVVESWASITAHYIHDVRPEAIRPQGEQTGNDAIVFVEAENKVERIKLDELLQSPEFASVRDKPENSPEWIEALRPAALAEGFNVPIAARLKFILRKSDGQWRIFAVDIGPAESAKR